MCDESYLAASVALDRHGVLSRAHRCSAHRSAFSMLKHQLPPSP